MVHWVVLVYPIESKKNIKLLKYLFFFYNIYIFTCLMVIAGRQSLSSSKSERQTVPDGYTFGWNSGGSNLHLGGDDG